MTGNKNTKPILIMMYVSLSTFTKRDILLLSDDFQVIPYHFETSKKWKLPVAFIKQFIFLVKNLRKTDVLVSQSSGYLSFIPSLFHRFLKTPLVLIAIGTDCVKFPEIKYGAHSKILLSWFTKFSFRNASLILPVHKALIFSKYTYYPIQFPEQGIKAFVKNLHTPITEVVNGFDSNLWKILPTERVKNSFLSITTSLSQTGYYLKGVDMMVAMAKTFPDYHFTIVGKVLLTEEVPTNMKIIENVPHEQLLNIYNQHQYYLQLSMSEGFPNTLCEAMLCGCIPIGSNVSSIPEIIGNQGFILEKKDKVLLKEVFENLAKSEISPIDVRNGIVEKFPLERRKKMLVDEITKTIR